MKYLPLILLLFPIQCFAKPKGKSIGVASYYYKPQNTASGKWFTPDKMWAAHRSLPFGTIVRVFNINNGKSVDVVVADRGPNIAGRIIDLSKAAFSKIESTKKGLTKVRIQVIGKKKSW